MSDPETQDLPELLREISEIDDDVVYHRDMGDLSRQILVWAPNLEGRMDFKKPTPGNIQAALQQRCRERGWVLDILTCPDKLDRAIIWLDNTSAVDGWAKNNPAHAACEAFLEALRADQ